MIVRALFWRPSLHRPLRFLMTILGVAAGVAAVVATLASSRAALASLRQGVTELAGGAALEIARPGGLDERDLGRLQRIAADAWIAPVIEEVALSTALHDSVRLFGVDPLVDGRVRDLGPAMREKLSVENAQSSFLALLQGKGAWISETLAHDLGLHAGDVLELDVRSRPKKVAILGTFPASEGSGALDRIVVVDIALAQELAGRIGQLDRIELVPKKGANLDELRARALALLAEGATVSAPSARAADAAGMVRSLEFNLTSLSGISLFVGAVLVATTLATSVVQRRRTIALFYSIGASRGQIVRAILTEALAIGLLGGIAGVVLGFVGARLLLASMRATVSSIVSGAPPSGIQLALDHALIGLALGVGASLVAAVLPVLEGARTPPIQAMRGETPRFLSTRGRQVSLGIGVLFVLAAVELLGLPAWNGLPVAALFGSLALLGAMFSTFGPAVDALGRVSVLRVRLPVSVRLACAGLSAGRRRAAWAAGAVGVAVALSISIATMVTSFRSTVIDWTEQSLHADLLIRPKSARTGLPVGKLAAELVARTREELGDDAIDPYYSARALFAGQRITLAGTALAVAGRRGGSAMLDGSDPRAAAARAAKEHEVLVNEAGAARFGWKKGDTIQVDVRGFAVVRKIAGVFRDYSDSLGIVLVDEEDFLAFFPGEGPRTIGVYCKTKGEVPAARRAIEGAIGADYSVEVLDNRTIRSNVLAVFDRTFAITNALQGVAAMVAVIAVLSVLYALVSERRADIALLSAIGAAGGQVRALVCVQAGLLGLLGAIGGAVTGLVIGLVLVRVVNLQSFGWTLTFVQPWSALASTALLVVAACVVAGLLPARAAAPSRLREALREE
jgi:putative ABC transport system permease protein